MKVVIADDAPAVRDRLSELLGEIQGIEIVGTAATASEALALVETHQPNVAILDIRMPEEGGIAALRQIKSQKLGPIVIMLTNYDDTEYRAACLSAGAELFLDKSHGLDHLVPLIRGLSKQFHALRTEITAHKQTSTALQQANERLRETMERLHLAVSGSTDGLWDVAFVPGKPWHDPAQPVWYSSRLREMLGFEEHEFPDVLASWDAQLHPDDRARVFAAVKEHLDRRTPRYDIEYRLFTKSGEPCWFRARGQALWDESGRATRMAGSLSDSTERKLLEVRFLQRQKMESLGRMAGGIAHDFNNVLTAILGYTELLLSRLLPQDEHYRFIRETRKASEYAVALTSQLLAFSRKQAHRPQILDLNALVRDMGAMLSRLLGNRIELITHLTPSLSPIFSDSSQIQQVLMNLAINARDAMLRRGTLTIETNEVELDEAFAQEHVSVSPGPYVMLAVTDTGCGMDEPTKSRIFEPFFTTKGDRGTGVGLATVYGIVKQSGGSIWVYSEPGRGATFKIYFPRVPQSGNRTTEPLSVLTAAPRGAETILLVDSDDVVRGMARNVLQSLGYNVVEASGMGESQEILREYHEPIHLLVTDAVMLKMSGRELAQKVLELRPGTKVMFMSGYTESYATAEGLMDPGGAFAQKPFTIHSLASKIRAVLDTTTPMAPDGEA
ncbi:MAG: response regulator [Nitrospira sp.]|nr:response regulator [Nitrospira sp.]